ncbi:DUF2735 domain-containing protein [Rhizobium sp. L1K21]|uniref:DUF2735 domain-containing protein n=1 Tax=Rhizobium sp. L1K21 TaxID=2954933 RepID=UPI0020931019|nr:DUF2735 domain-containing protein [Rhizobium sp. L1K21]MCO6186952.1 DUF2735 domain-containing protein [Rhizobium sp. L1K21]
MKLDHQRSSAKIYAFPVNRIVRSAAMRELDALERGELDSLVDTDSWYHQDAIDEKDAASHKKQ